MASTFTFVFFPIFPVFVSKLFRILLCCWKGISAAIYNLLNPWLVPRPKFRMKVSFIISHNVYMNFLSRWHIHINTWRSRQNGRLFPDDIFICMFLNGNEWHSIKISLRFVPKVLIHNIPALVQIIAWRRPGDKPLSETMIFGLPTHICVTRPQWVR